MRRKCHIIVIKNLFQLDNLVSYLQASLKECKYVLKSNELEICFDKEQNKAKYQDTFLKNQF